MITVTFGEVLIMGLLLINLLITVYGKKDHFKKDV